MNVQCFNKVLSLVFCMIVFPLSLCALSFEHEKSGFNVTFFGLLKEDFFASVNSNLLDSQNFFDRSIFARHTFDLGLNISDLDLIIEFNAQLRNKGVWGNSTSLGATNFNTVKVQDVLTIPHQHGFTRHLLWIRELWLKIDLNKLFNLCLEHSHYLTAGLLPFQITSRGIALGDAYAVGPVFLGYFTDSTVDQFAPSLKFSGNITDDLSYVIIALWLENFSDSLRSTTERIYTQRYGRRNMAERGFGNMNYAFAGYLDWYAMNDKVFGSLRFRPYGLFNHAKEQKVEFRGDASSKLGTLGMECEYIGDKLEIGIEGAFNLGEQTVFGWDRNQVIFENNQGNVAQVNSHVFDSTNKKIPFIAGGNAQRAIFQVNQSACENGKQIPGTFDQVGFLMPPDGEIFNAPDRFRDCYRNKYQGWMIISDASLWVYEKDFKVAATLGVASGDDNPNFDTMDRNYKGFIGLQESYSGKRVKSAFFLGGAGRVTRPIANPLVVGAVNDAPLTVALSGFTNLILAGGGFSWEPTAWERPIKINPNFLAYWQFKSTPKFRAVTVAEDMIPDADKFLGIEANIFADYNPVKNFKIFVVTSIFGPGQFYSDIKGRRLSQQDILDQIDAADRTGFVQDTIPRFGDDIAFTFDIGFEYRF